MMVDCFLVGCQCANSVFLRIVGIMNTASSVTGEYGRFLDGHNLQTIHVKANNNSDRLVYFQDLWECTWQATYWKPRKTGIWCSLKQCECSSVAG